MAPDTNLNAVESEIFNLPEVEIRPIDAAYLILAMVPAAWVVWNGPHGAFHSLALAKQYQAGTAPYGIGPWLVHIASHFLAFAWLMILAQAFALIWVIISVAWSAERLFPGRYAGICAAVALATSLDWVRGYSIVSPDPLANSLGALGVLGLLRSKHYLSESSLMMGLASVLTLTVAALINPFWWLILAASLASLVAHSRPGIIVSLLITIACLFYLLPDLKAVFISQTPQGKVLPNQALGGYPDFLVGHAHLSDSGFVSQAFLKLKVGLVRILVELVQVRSVYSWKHNLAITMNFWPFIALCLIGLIRFRKLAGMPSLAVLLGWWSLFVGTTYADWNGRFVQIIWPIVVLIASGMVFQVILNRFLWKGLSYLLLIMLGAVMFHRPLLDGLGRWLVVDDRQPTDVMVVLVGGDPDRDTLAAQLFHQGYSREIWLANENDMAETDPRSDAGALIRRLKEKGVPRENIKLLASASNTTGEARRVAEHVAGLDPSSRPRSINVVTTSFHTRRARLIFRRYLAPLGVTLHVTASVDQQLPIHQWWTYSHARHIYTEEYAKWLFSLLGLG